MRIGKAREPADLPTIAELPPREELHDVEPRAVDPNAAQLIELSHPGDRRVIRHAQQRAARARLRARIRMVYAWTVSHSRINRAESNGGSGVPSHRRAVRKCVGNSRSFASGTP
jgi:hypothetical protein